MTDVGNLKNVLGLIIDREAKRMMKISQLKYVMDLLVCFGMVDYKPATTPLELNLKLEQGEYQIVTTEPYRELIDCLTYLALASRPDISAAVTIFSRYPSAHSKNTGVI